MKNTNYLLSILAAASVALGQSSESTETAGCTNLQISSCLLHATPSGLVQASTATNLECGDQGCVCSAMSLAAECYRTYCPEVDTSSIGFGEDYTRDCGQILGLGKITGSASIAVSASKTAPSANTASVTSAPGMTTPAATAASTSTSPAKGQGMVNAVPIGGLLAGFIGLLAFL